MDLAIAETSFNIQCFLEVFFCQCGILQADISTGSVIIYLFQQFLVMVTLVIRHQFQYCAIGSLWLKVSVIGFYLE